MILLKIYPQRFSVFPFESDTPGAIDMHTVAFGQTMECMEVIAPPSSSIQRSGTSRQVAQDVRIDHGHGPGALEQASGLLSDLRL